MKRAFFFVTLFLLVGAFLYQKIAEGSGYILISLGNTSVEMSFWLGLAILLGTLFALWLVWQLIASLIGAFTSGAGRLFISREKSVQRKTARGLIAFMEGHWKQARKQLISSANKAEYPIINYLAAARSTYELGNDQEALELLHKAEKSSGESALAVALTQARMLLVNKKYEKCLANLEKARKLAPHHPVVLDLLQQTYLQLQDWPALKSLVPELEREKILSATELEQLQHKLFTALLSTAGEKARRLSTNDAAKVLREEWNGFPKTVQKQVPMLLQYAKLLVESGNDAEAEAMLRKELYRNWHDELVEYYGCLAGKDTKKQLLRAEGWLKERPGNAALLLTLGRLCLRNQLWGQAREYFESSLKLKKNPQTFAELARLLAHMGQYQRGTELYQQGLSLITDGLPGLPLPEALQAAPDSKTDTELEQAQKSKAL